MFSPSFNSSFPSISTVAPSWFATASISNFSNPLKSTLYSNLSVLKFFNSTFFIFKLDNPNVDASLFVTVIVYTFDVPSSALTVTVITFSPTVIFSFPSTFTVAFSSSASATTFISFSF